MSLLGSNFIFSFLFNWLMKVWNLWLLNINIIKNIFVKSTIIKKRWVLVNFHARQFSHVATEAAKKWSLRQINLKLFQKLRKKSQILILSIWNEIKAHYQTEITYRMVKDKVKATLIISNSLTLIIKVALMMMSNYKKIVRKKVNRYHKLNMIQIVTSFKWYHNSNTSWCKANNRYKFISFQCRSCMLEMVIAHPYRKLLFNKTNNNNNNNRLQTLSSTKQPIQNQNPNLKWNYRSLRLSPLPRTNPLYHQMKV